MLNCSDEVAEEFIKSIEEARKNLRYCSICFNISDTDPCMICGNPRRDNSVICVVEDVKDIICNGKDS